MIRRSLCLFKSSQISSTHIALKNLSNLKAEDVTQDFEITHRNYPSFNKDYISISIINDKICKKLEKHPIYGPIKDYSRLIKILRNHGIPSDDIVELLPTNLIHKMDLSDENWKSALGFLKSLGSSKSTVLKVLSTCPQLIEGDTETMNSIINLLAMLRTCNVSNYNAFLVATLNPQLLTTPYSKIINTNQKLQKYFTKSDIQSLIIKSPNILTDNWEEIEKKIFYCHLNMGITGKEISQSRCFSWSLRQIIARHLFLERAGLFKTMKIKTSKSSSIKSLNTGSGIDQLTQQNPSAAQIFNYTDDVFAAKTCEMSAEEFATFSLCLSNEIEFIELKLDVMISRRSRDISRNKPTEVNDDDSDNDDNDDGDSGSDEEDRGK